MVPTYQVSKEETAYPLEPISKESSSRGRNIFGVTDGEIKRIILGLLPQHCKIVCQL
jgi:hypothetical protein